MASESLPVRLPMTLQQFLDYTGWEGSASQDRMTVALEHFQNTVPLGYLGQPVKDPVTPEGRSLGPTPWSVPKSSRTDRRPSGPHPRLVASRAHDRTTINLCLLMQTIDFSHPVSVWLIPKGTLLKAFHTASDPVGRPGCFFTLQQTSSGSLAIPRDQMAARVYEATCSFVALASIVADAYVDWAMNRGVSPQYQHGGGRQLYIWRPELRLRSVPTSDAARLGSAACGFQFSMKEGIARG